MFQQIFNSHKEQEITSLKHNRRLS